MRITELKQLTGSGYEEELWRLCCEADREFIPPLSSRESTTQGDLSGGEAVEAPHTYFEGLKKQHFVLVEDEGRVLGFLSYRFGAEGFSGDCVYVSTIIVDRLSRGNKLTEKMYGFLFEKEKGLPVLTRTWSQNSAHLRILDKLGFALVKRIKDHRGPGIDTVYYGKEP